MMFTAYKKFWTHYADFEGKSTRPEYWWSVLCNVLITLPFGIMAFGSILVAIFNVVQQATYYDYEGEFDPSIFISSLGSEFFIIILLSVFGIATLVPNLAIIVRRLYCCGFTLYCDSCSSFAWCWLSLGIYLFICRSYTFDVGSIFKYLGCFSYVTMFYRSNCPTLYAN